MSYIFITENLTLIQLRLLKLLMLKVRLYIFWDIMVFVFYSLNHISFKPLASLGVWSCLAGPDWIRAWVFVGPGLDQGLTGPGLGWTRVGWTGPNLG